MRIQLTNLDAINHTEYIRTGYVGCGVPFYLETTSVPQPFVMLAGQTVSVTLTIWPDSATPGTWTFEGIIETS